MFHGENLNAILEKEKLEFFEKSDEIPPRRS